MKKFVTIDDLNWKEHPVNNAGFRAEIHFENGFGASVISGLRFYCTKEKPFEIGVLFGEELTYKTPITSDVCGYLSNDEANEILRKIQKLSRIYALKIYFFKVLKWLKFQLGV
jgi:hypothetical protein